MRGTIRTLVLTALITPLMAVATGCHDPEESPEARGETPPLPPMDCELEGYPCTWDEVDTVVVRRTYAMFDPALDLMYLESPTALWDWLHARPDLGAAGVVGDTTAIWFRLKGGRPVYVFGPHRHELVPSGTLPVDPSGPLPGDPSGALSGGPSSALSDDTSGPLHADLVSPLRAVLEAAFDHPASARNTPLPAAPPATDVTGRDRNEDTRVNQRDERRALVMDPLYFEFCYYSIEDLYETPEEKKEHVDAITAICEGRESPASLGWSSDQLYRHGERVAEALGEIPAYRGNVTLLKDEAADHEVIATWGQYDVIHLSTHGAPGLMAFGEVFPLEKGEHPQLPPRPFPTAVVALSKAGTFGPNRGAWAVGDIYVREVLEGALDRTFLFVSTCESLSSEGSAPVPGLVTFLAGATTGVLGWTVPVPYNEGGFLAGELYDLLSRGWTVKQARDSLRLRRSEFLQGSSNEEIYFLVSDLEYYGKDLRIFEIPTLRAPGGAPPAPPGPPLQDGAPLTASVISGQVQDDLDDSLSVDVEVVAITEDQASSTSVRLEWDGASIGSPRTLGKEFQTGPNRYRIPFEGIPLGQDLKKDTEYELEAVVELPEGGESRQSVRLRDRSGCYWRISYLGARTGEAEGTQVYHFYDGGGPIPPGGAGRDPRLTRQIGGALTGRVGFTISFGERPPRVGTTGTFLGGISDDDLSSLSLKFPDIEFPWENEMTGERRPFTVEIQVNQEERIAGTFGGSLLNVPWRNPGGYGKPTIDYGNIELEGEFQWTLGCASREG